MSALIYHLMPHSAHRLRIRLQIASAGEKLQCYLPIWIPGSYTRRDFSRYLNILKVENNGKTVAWQLENPSAWSAQGEAGDWLVEYEVYARDYSVRGCYLDDVRAMINPACACLAVRGAEQAEHHLIWQPDESRRDWHSAGAIPSADNQWQFDDYQTLIDTPLMFARDLLRCEFEAGGIRHEIAVCGHHGQEDDIALKLLDNDIADICRNTIAQFGGLPEDVPFYSFLLFLTENGYGGLEHQRSTLLISSREAFSHGNKQSYIQLLNLFSHEYFHTWNVKSLRPKAYAKGYELEHEHISDMLWLFEGFTAYFDSLILLRANTIDKAQYLRLFSQDISRHLQRQGQHYQTLARSSLESWTKLYNGGENAPNISTNYYIHGALAAWCIDAYLHRYSLDRQGLDQRLAEIWQQAAYRAQGIDEADFIRHAQSRLPPERQAEFADFIRRLIHECDYLPLEFAAETFGLRLKYYAPPQEANAIGNHQLTAVTEAGIRWQEQQGKFYVRLNDPDSPAAKAGIAANDEIIAVCGEQANAANLWRRLMRGSGGETVSIHILRDGLHHEYSWKLRLANYDTAWLSIDEQAENEAADRRRQWWRTRSAKR